MQYIFWGKTGRVCSKITWLLLLLNIKSHGGVDPYLLQHLWLELDSDFAGQPMNVNQHFINSMKKKHWHQYFALSHCVTTVHECQCGTQLGRALGGSVEPVGVCWISPGSNTARSSGKHHYCAPGQVWPHYYWGIAVWKSDKTVHVQHAFPNTKCIPGWRHGSGDGRSKHYGMQGCEAAAGTLVPGECHIVQWVAMTFPHLWWPHNLSPGMEWRSHALVEK